VSSQVEETPLERESALLVAFVNTRDLETQVDEISSPRALEKWIAASDAGIGAPNVETAGHRRVLALREALRALLRANNGGVAAHEDVVALHEACARARYRASIGPDAVFRIDPDGDGLDAFEERLVLAIERVQALGGWARLKACPAEDCEWAFIDSSRNRSRTWCSMDVCGNRSKTRRYRSRRARG
jgi:predicted RNA-binding Zn ribbon-like protein